MLTVNTLDRVSFTDEYWDIPPIEIWVDWDVIGDVDIGALILALLGFGSYDDVFPYTAHVWVAIAPLVVRLGLPPEMYSSLDLEVGVSDVLFDIQKEILDALDGTSLF